MTNETFKILAQNKTNAELIEIKKEQKNYAPDFIYYIDAEIKSRNIPDELLPTEQESKNEAIDKYSEFNTDNKFDFEKISDEDLSKLFLDSLEDINPDYIQSIVQELAARNLFTEELKERRMKSFDQSKFNKRGNLFSIILGYLLSALFISGLIIPILYMKKRTNCMGEKQYIYDEKTRRHAKIMAIICISEMGIFFFFYVVIWIARN